MKLTLEILLSKFDSATLTFAPDEEILNALQQSHFTQEGMNFEETQELCMPFLSFKKEEVKAVGVQALDMKQPFGEIEVLKEILELTKRRVRLEQVEILSVTDPYANERAGPHASLLKQNPPSPGSPPGHILEFEMPYHIWCGGCNSMIAKVMRFNAEKKQVGNYNSTKIWSFKLENITLESLLVHLRFNIDL